jgi:hypothetical protein
MFHGTLKWEVARMWCFVNKVMNFRVRWKSGNSLTSWATVILPRRTVLDAISWEACYCYVARVGYFCRGKELRQNSLSSCSDASFVTKWKREQLYSARSPNRVFGISYSGRREFKSQPRNKLFRLRCFMVSVVSVGKSWDCLRTDCRSSLYSHLFILSIRYLAV